jgi:hypothetical protein
MTWQKNRMGANNIITIHSGGKNWHFANYLFIYRSLETVKNVRFSIFHPEYTLPLKFGHRKVYVWIPIQKN